MTDFDEYEKTYKILLRGMTSEQVVNLLINNIRNQEQKRKDGEMNDDELKHAEKLSINIMILREEILKRIERGRRKNDSRTIKKTGKRLPGPIRKSGHSI